MTTKEQNKLIWSVAAFTSSVIMLLGIIAFSCVAIFAPRVYADFVYAIGFKNSSLKSYEYNYNKTHDINDLYLLVSKSIFLNNSDYIVSSYEKLADREEYDEFIDYVNQANLNNATSRFYMMFVANEDNYLKNKYVEALYKSDKEKAFNYAYSDLTNSRVTNLSDKTNFVLSGFISLCESEDAIYFTSEVVDSIIDYYNNLLSIFESEYEGLSNLENSAITKYYLSVLGYRLIDISKSLNKLDDIITPSWDTQLIDSKANFIDSKIYELTI